MDLDIDRLIKGGDPMVREDGGVDIQTVFNEVQASRFDELCALASEILDDARNTLAIRFRFLDQALWLMPYDLSSDYRYIGTDGTVIFCDPDYVVSRFTESPSEVVRDVLHNLFHCVFHHPFLHYDVKRNEWDLACDIAVESLVMELASSRFPSGLDDDRAKVIRQLKRDIEVLTAERLYRSLREESGPFDAFDKNDLVMLFMRDAHERWYDDDSEGPSKSKGADKDNPDETRSTQSGPGQGDSQQDENDGQANEAQSQPEQQDDSDQGDSDEGESGQSDEGQGGSDTDEGGSPGGEGQEGENETDEDDGGGGSFGARSDDSDAQGGKPQDAQEDADADAQSQRGSSEGDDQDDGAGGQHPNPDESGTPQEGDGSQSEAEDRWRDIGERMQVEMESYSSQSTGAGELTARLSAVNREKYDYADFLKRFAVLGERMMVNDEEYDYIFYTYGLKLYRNMPLIEPLEYKEVKSIRDFVIAIDTSESCEGSLVRAFVRKTYGILKQTEHFHERVNVHIVQCDAKVQQDHKITSLDELDEYAQDMQLFGFGGTDFRPVFEYVDQLVDEGEFVNLRGIIYFTDGKGVFPPMKPDYDAAFVFVDDGYSDPAVPPWAIKLILDEHEIEDEDR